MVKGMTDNLYIVKQQRDQMTDLIDTTPTPEEEISSLSCQLECAATVAGHLANRAERLHNVAQNLLDRLDTIIAKEEEQKNV